MSGLWSVPSFLLSATAGALSGGIVSIAIGARKAEREERGKRRMEVRIRLGKAIRLYRHDYKKARLLRLENQVVEDTALLRASLDLAFSANACAQVLPVLERVRMRRSVASIVGIEMLILADLQVEGADEISAAALHMVAEKCRIDPRETMRLLVQADPSDTVWDEVLRHTDKLARKYS